ncbi:hypothetical protein LX32DRAFT_633568 [Colletotrichum zoysiae]|uniref:Uncharacterized protein n=1 Tax=Colletotrichum zoysiae TaxID=1216348 RepID=A0AAD9HVN4_9PEZI|nr:hypothetical protein LX32DRAFT_633568 [Colletotrichum zoysiae]
MADANNTATSSHIHSLRARPSIHPSRSLSISPPFPRNPKAPKARPSMPERSCARPES